MFKDLPEGQTHYKNDGCGEPEHNTTNQQNREENWKDELAELARKENASLLSRPLQMYDSILIFDKFVLEEFIQSTRQSAAKEAREDTINKIGEFIELHNTFNKQEMIDYLNWLKQLTTN